MEKRFQVFVSSTFADLQEERQEVMQALLELDCIPAGMELFPAANSDQWTLIKKVIDDCDYYIVIVAGRYGSLGPDGFSYTEMEYRYALEVGKPVLGFIHKNPGVLPANRCEASDDGKTKLAAFRKLVETKMCRHWDSAADLGSQVSRSLIKLIKTQPAIGWVRGNLVPNESAAEELLDLRKQIDILQRQLSSSRTSGPEGADKLAQGEDVFHIRYSFAAVPEDRSLGRSTYLNTADVSWDDIFASVSPLMIDEISEFALGKALDRFIDERERPRLQKTKQFKHMELSDFDVDGMDFQTIKIQLRALGLMTQSAKNRSVRDTSSYWTLTPYGDTVMTRLCAIPRGNTGPPAPSRK